MCIRDRLCSMPIRAVDLTLPKNLRPCTKERAGQPPCVSDATWYTPPRPWVEEGGFTGVMACTINGKGVRFSTCFEPVKLFYTRDDQEPELFLMEATTNRAKVL